MKGLIIGGVVAAGFATWYLYKKSKQAQATPMSNATANLVNTANTVATQPMTTTAQKITDAITQQVQKLVAPTTSPAVSQVAPAPAPAQVISQPVYTAPVVKPVYTAPIPAPIVPAYHAPIYSPSYYPATSTVSPYLINKKPILLEGLR